jgi:aspartate carbamoyltransferase catalytic subunit
MSHIFSRRHLIDTDVLSRADIEAILDLADHYAKQNRSRDKKIDKFRGKTCVNLFFENSTRTRTSFEIAAKRLGADVVNIPVSQSSTAKGETLIDTALTLDAMRIDALVVRHAEEGMPERIADCVEAHVINAGDGTHAHPTQALLDAMTIRRHKGKFEGLKVAICGDLARSRVARSNIHLLSKFGAEIRVVAPDFFMSDDYKNLDVEICPTLESGISDADVIIMLRIQHERPGLAFDFAAHKLEYIASYGLNHDRLKAAKPDVIVLHPGPTNRGVEVTDELADDKRHSVIREQVEMGVAVRMAVIDLLLSQVVGA